MLPSEDRLPSEDGSPPCAAPLYSATSVLPACTHAVRSIEHRPCCTLPSPPVRPLVSTMYYCPPVCCHPCTASRTRAERSDRAPLMPYAPSGGTHAVRSILSHSCCTLHRAPPLLYAPSSTTHAVRHASSRRSRHASCVKQSIDHRRARTIWFA